MDYYILCCAYMGPEFRNEFSRIGGLRALIKCPFMSLTASAPPSVESDIKLSLHLQNTVCIRHPLNRPNIYISVKKKSFLAVSFPNDFLYIILLDLLL